MNSDNQNQNEEKDFQELMNDGILHDNNSLRESFDNRTRSSSTCLSKKT